jgi:hypothetical protein
MTADPTRRELEARMLKCGCGFQGRTMAEMDEHSLKHYPDCDDPGCVICRPGAASWRQGNEM